MILYKGADSEAQGPRRFWRVWTVMTPNPSQGARDTMNLLGMPVTVESARGRRDFQCPIHHSHPTLRTGATGNGEDTARR
jgi:hypothetical protein